MLLGFLPKTYIVPGFIQQFCKYDCFLFLKEIEMSERKWLPLPKREMAFMAQRIIVSPHSKRQLVCIPLYINSELMINSWKRGICCKSQKWYYLQAYVVCIRILRMEKLFNVQISMFQIVFVLENKNLVQSLGHFC